MFQDVPVRGLLFGEVFMSMVVFQVFQFTPKTNLCLKNVFLRSVVFLRHFSEGENYSRTFLSVVFPECFAQDGRISRKFY